jgi:hypothetical protein
MIRLSRTGQAEPVAAAPTPDADCCANCGRAFKRTRRWKRFCQDQCRGSYHRRLAERRKRLGDHPPDAAPSAHQIINASRSVIRE